MSGAARYERSQVPATWRPDTLAVRGGLARSEFDETAEALFLTSGFVYDSAAAAEAAFAGEVDRYIYSRYGNPTVTTFEQRLRLVEGAPACFATASGMAAVWVALAALVQAGDRVVAARSLFGSCFVILDELLPRFGVTTEFVDGHDLAQWERALSTPATAVFFESPSNPMQEPGGRARRLRPGARGGCAGGRRQRVRDAGAAAADGAWAPTSSSTRRRSTSTARAARSVARCSARRSSSTAPCRR
ncbi:hypothetical protein GCM10025868_45700 [Angustibacter aerolatus]|uniref:O-succinylhomoserine sulfhydrylase n=1 Tax=Angustibacter aerolatus TaxID=1162965 RepID=A0ABQ6JRK6_9ACTN|nr:PLP-dependent transferase [Angustibacter aerolatus]GMA89320.1 hypothetical protein GCM10025868_45700 [Angustibacter aerolatus]